MKTAARRLRQTGRLAELRLRPPRLGCLGTAAHYRPSVVVDGTSVASTVNEKAFDAVPPGFCTLTE
jgi:hypothetical protein